VIDTFLVIGLFGFRRIMVYWIVLPVSAADGETPVGRPQGVLRSGAATWFCFIRLMLGCMGGGCADEISPFLEYAMLYAGISVVLIGLMHLFRQ
jgi:hypothetical protein